MSRTNLDNVRRDFDAIAIAADKFGSGSDRYDNFLCDLVPRDAVHIVDIGCGLGRLSIRLANRGHSVLGIDLSPEMVHRARENAEGQPNVQFICGNFLAMPELEGRFDCVVTAATLHHVDADDGYLHCMKMLRPGGTLIVHDLRATDGMYDKFRALLTLVPSAFRRILKTGSPFMPRHIRKLWLKHGSKEMYLNVSDVQSLVQRLMPEARIWIHRDWRYTVVWRNANEGKRGDC